LALAARIIAHPARTLRDEIARCSHLAKKDVQTSRSCSQHCGAFYLAIKSSSFSALFLRILHDTGPALGVELERQNWYVDAMKIDPEKVDDAVLALLWLGVFDEFGSTWKTFDWSAMDRLHARDLISNPKGRQKSVVLSSEGKARAESLCRAMFAREQVPKDQ
jgi:hypothetical protein